MKKITAVSAVLAAALTLCTACGDTVKQMDSKEADTTQPADITGYPDDFSEATEAEPVELTTESAALPEGYQPNGYACLPLEAVLQNPELPSGCEITALTTALNYCGFQIDKVDLYDDFLEKDYCAAYTFNEAYVGDAHMDNGFGCYAPVITETANKFFEYEGVRWHAENISDTEFTDLFYQLDQGRPIVIWSTVDQMDGTMKLMWTTADGDEAWFTGAEHCMVLHGYDLDAGIVYAADPLKGNVTYDLNRFSETYGMIWKQAVVLVNDDPGTPVSVPPYVKQPVPEEEAPEEAYEDESYSDEEDYAYGGY